MDQKALIQTAALAHLHLSNEEMQEFQLQLSEVLKFFDKIKTFPIEKGLETLVDPLDAYRKKSLTENILRQDKVENNYSSEDLIACAPACIQQEYLVPPVME